MFNFFKKKQNEPKVEEVKNLKALVDGRALPLEEVPDEIFSSKAMGDGMAFDASSSVIVAPCDCKIETMNPDMKHAIGLKLNNGMEILIHVGVDTVKLNGKGFNQLVKEGVDVKAGEPLLEFDKEVIKAAGLCDWIMMIITENGNVSEYRMNFGEVQKNSTVVVEW